MSPPLSHYRNNGKQRKHVLRAEDTADLILKLWRAGRTRRKDREFLATLVRCGWNNESKRKGGKSTIRWRNSHIVDGFGFHAVRDDDDLANRLARFKSFKKDAKKFVRIQAGVTHCYGAVRSETLSLLENQPGLFTKAFSEVAKRGSPEKKIARVMKLIDKKLTTQQGRQIYLQNGLTPALACLDPDRCFPILNGKTNAVLKKMWRMEPDHLGAQKLYSLIGDQLGIKNSFELDAYLTLQVRKKRRSPKRRSRRSTRRKKV